MSVVYLLVMSSVDEGDGVDDVCINTKVRAFGSPIARMHATHDVIDDMLKNIDATTQCRFDDEKALRDNIDDMLYARTRGDTSYEMLCCRDVFGIDFEFQDVKVESP